MTPIGSVKTDPERAQVHHSPPPRPMVITDGGAGFYMRAAHPWAQTRKTIRHNAQDHELLLLGCSKN